MAQYNTCTQFVFAELLSLILEHSTTSDLLQHHRLVNQQWRQIATKTLLKRGSLQIMFKLDRKRPPKDNPPFRVSKQALANRTRILCWGHYKPTSDLIPVNLTYPRNRSLPNFYRLVTNPPSLIIPSIPVDHFDFSVLGANMDISQPQMTSFFQVYGPKIRMLTLDNFTDYFLGDRGAPNFLLQYTPNLESLCIGEVLQFGADVAAAALRLNQQNIFTLHRLKRIEVDLRPKHYAPPSVLACQPTFTILSFLLKIAPQLERIFFRRPFELSMIKVFPPSQLNLLRISALHLDKEVLLPEEKMGQAALALDDFVQAVTKTPNSGFCLRLLHIDLRFLPYTWTSWKRASAALYKIMEAASNSLEQIDLYGEAVPILHKIPGLSPLPKVRVIKLEFHGDVHLHTFPENGDPKLFEFFMGSGEGTLNLMSDLLPNLETVELSILKHHDDPDRMSLPLWTNETLTGVKTLKTRLYSFGGKGAQIGSQVIAKFMGVCPEVTALETVWPYLEFPLLVAPIWKLSQLTTLILEFKVTDRYILGSFVDLDSAITGLSKESVTAIYSMWEQTGQWKENEKEGFQGSRVKSGSISDLQNLQELHLTFHIDHDMEPRLLISGVSATFGFDLIKNLKVQIVLNCFTGLVKSSCPECTQKDKYDRWMTLYEPLATHPNVTLEKRFTRGKLY